MEFQYDSLFLAQYLARLPTPPPRLFSCQPKNPAFEPPHSPPPSPQQFRRSGFLFSSIFLGVWAGFLMFCEGVKIPFSFSILPPTHPGGVQSVAKRFYVLCSFGKLTPHTPPTLDVFNITDSCSVLLQFPSPEFSYRLRPLDSAGF